MSTKNPNPFTNPPTKKKHLWWLWIPLIIIAVIVVVPVGFVMGLFFDPSHYDTGVTEPLDGTLLMNEVKLGLFDDCRDNSEDPTIGVTITQDNLNRMLLSVSELVNSKIPTNVASYVKVEQFSVQITDTNYIFDVEASALGFFKTHATLVLKVEMNADIGEGEKGFIFDIVNARVGRLDGMVEAASSFINLKQMIEGVEQVHWTYDEANTRIIYSNANFQNDLVSLAGLGEGLFGDLFNTFFEKDLFKLTQTNGSLSGKISIANFRKNDTFYSDALTIQETEEVGGVEKLVLISKAEAVQQLMNAGVITEQLATEYDLTLDVACFAVHKFLAFGIDFVESGNQRSFVESLVTSAAFVDLIGGKTIPQYSADRRLAYFGPTDTGFVDEIKNNALTKVTGKVKAAADADKELVASFEGLTQEEIISMIINGDPISIDKEDLKTTALFRGIQGKINNAREKAWYLYGGDNTTYYFNNASTDWTRVYANAYNTEDNIYEATGDGIRMTYVQDNIWSYDVPAYYDVLTINNGAGESYSFSLDANKRYFNGTVAEEVPASIVDTPNTIRLYDSNIHDLVKDNSYIVGFGFPFAGKAADGTYKYAYTMVDNIYPITTIIEDQPYFALVFGLNINGTETQLVLPCEQVTSYTPTEENVFGLKFSIANAKMYYGNEEVPGVKSTLDNLMKNAASSMTSSFFSIDEEATSMTFTIDLRDLVTTGDFKTLHDHLVSNDPTDDYACNARLFVHIIPSVNPVEQQATKGIGGFDIEVGYEARP